jgi:hypothetical protein
MGIDDHWPHNPKQRITFGHMRFNRTKTNCIPNFNDLVMVAISFIQWTNLLKSCEMSLVFLFTYEKICCNNMEEEC